MDSITEEGIKECFEELRELIKKGSITAIKVYLEYGVGKPMPADVMERLNEIEAALGIGTDAN